MNAAAENLLGTSRDRALARSFTDLLDDEKAVTPVLEQALANEASFTFDVGLPASDGRPAERAIECRASVLDSPEVETMLIVELIDITRRARINRENALLVQHGAGRQMVRQLAHEIKNPLGGLRGAAQLLARELDSRHLEEYTDVIISEADRLAALVDTLLGPGGPPSKTYVNLHELLEYVLKLLEPAIGDAPEVCREYDPGLPDLFLDRDQIVQALINVMQNALAALAGQGTLTLRTQAELNFTINDVRYPVVALIDVEDDGPGIPPELQDSVFYPLVTSRPEGTGLGLPIAQELISRHNGMIEFESRPGRTVFSVRIPLLQDPA